MDTETMKLFFALLRSAIGGGDLTEAERALYVPERLGRMVQVAKQHDVLHLLAQGLKQNGLPGGEVGQRLENEIFKAVWRYEQMRHELEGLCSALEKAQIPFLPLKGAVIRDLYPEPWMRTSCDIDVLVHEEDCEKAGSVLVDDYGYTYQGKESHDISLFTSTNVHVELHYDLIEDGRANDSSNVLKAVWNTSRIRDGYTYCHEMPDELFYFYHIAHMAKHFEDGGCGIRPFIDLWILDGIQGADQNKRDELLRQGDLLKFAEAARKLSRIWFENEQHDNVSQQLENYILCGGVYGNRENRITVQQQKKGGRIKYALSRIVIPYDVIKFHYPILQKHRWLTPFMEVRRWGKLIFCGRAKSSLNELKYNQKLSAEKALETRIFLENIGL